MTVHSLPTATLTAPATGSADPTSGDDKLSLAEILLTTAMDLRAAGVLDEASELAHRVVALEMALGVSLLSLRPTAHGFKSPTDIGRELGVSANKVGRTITALGLRQVRPGVATRILVQLNSKWVLGWAYGPSAVDAIRAHLAAPCVA